MGKEIAEGLPNSKTTCVPVQQKGCTFSGKAICASSQICV